MISLFDLLTISIIVLVVFLIFATYSLIRLLADMRDVVRKNKKQIEGIVTDVSKLTNETVTLEEKIKNYVIELVNQFISGKLSNKEESK